MKVKVKGNPITPYGSFSDGQVLSDDKFSREFLSHLVNDAGAADLIEYETKVVEDYEPVKKPQSSRSSQPGKASQKKTRVTRKRKAKS